MAQQASFDFEDDGTETPTAPVATTEPLAYELRVSRRARRVTLRVVHGRGLVVTIPQRYPRRDVAEVVESHREWALQALEELDAKTPGVCLEWPPRQLELQATGSRVWVVFDTRPGAGDLALSASLDYEHVLRLSCNPEDRVAVATAVGRYLRPAARAHLSARAVTLAARHRMSFERLTVRGQRSVWGSYSSSGTLSLNYKLMFLKPALVDYVVLHELAHTRHLDHSSGFWTLLEQMCPNSRQLDKELSAAGQRVPPWLELAK